MPTMQLLIRLLRDTRGMSAVEYGLMLGLIFFAMLVGLNGFAGQIKSTWNNVSTQTQTATSQALPGA